MANTASTLGTTTSIIAGAWTTPASILAENDNVTFFTTTTKNDVRTLEVGNFGFGTTLPAIAGITRVDYTVRESRTSGGTNATALVRASVEGAYNNTNNNTLTTTTYGNEGRPGGGSWTRNDLLNGVFAIRVRGTQPNNTTSRTYQFAWVEAIVYYTTQPSVLSSLVSSVGETTAIGEGNVTSDGESAILERGFVWNTSPNPTTANFSAQTAGTTGAYQSSITGLTPATSYFSAAYAINANASVYGTDIAFSTSPSSGGIPDPFQSYIGAFSVIPKQYRNLIFK